MNVLVKMHKIIQTNTLKTEKMIRKYRKTLTKHYLDSKISLDTKKHETVFGAFPHRGV